MDYFNQRNGQLYTESIPVTDIVKQYGTPCYIYSRATFERHFKAYVDSCGSQAHLICYAVKANSNIAVLNLLARKGAGFDIVSIGELERVLAAGGDASKIVFSGIGKQAYEIQRALQVGVFCFNVESEAELILINQIAGDMKCIAPISLRVNPDVDAKTHPYISTGLKENKFGIDINIAPQVYRQAVNLPHIEIRGVDCHIGSQLTDMKPFLDALDRVLALIDTLKKESITLHHIDLGGGLGVTYSDETPPHPSVYAQAIVEKIKGRDLTLIFEPGRSIAANSGILVTKVILLKQTADKNFAVVDAAMNDLLRPALYQAWQTIEPVTPRTGETKEYDIVGPICETGDFLGKNRDLCIEAEDLLAIRSSGAYAFSMSSNYNSRNRAVEIMVDGEQTHIIRRRETIADQIAPEACLPD